MDVIHSILDQALAFVESLATVVPLELFVILGSIIEEILAPIPSPIVMVLAGSLAGAKGSHWITLLFLALLGAVGKTIGAWFLYVVADKLEDVVVGKFGRLLGVSHKSIESIGKKLSGGWKDDVFLFIARALPIMPSAPISVACGVIKVNLRTYLGATFFGTTVRNLLYLYLGFAGLGNYKHIAEGLEGWESLGQIVLFVIIALLIVWAYRKRKQHHVEE